jgi:DNA-binding HxlR family transcriptional regulator
MAARRGYGQFCPVAKAAEIVAERWTPLVLRELIAGSRHFNELRRGLPLMSSALLSRRLKELEDAGVVERRVSDGRTAEYYLSEAGLELRPIIEALGFWGARWTRSHLTSQDYDPSLLMWDIRRNIDVSQLPAARRTVIEIELGGTNQALRRWWLVVADGEVDLCLKDPGYEVDLRVFAELRALVEIWLGTQSIQEAARKGRVKFEGPRTLASNFQRSLRLSPFASSRGAEM